MSTVSQNDKALRKTKQDVVPVRAVVQMVSHSAVRFPLGAVTQSRALPE